jgi:ribosome-associated protein
MPSITLKGDHITLAQAIKVAGLTESGGQAKNLVRDGSVFVNGVAESQPGRKLKSGDRFRVEDGDEWTVEAG